MFKSGIVSVLLDFSFSGIFGLISGTGLCCEYKKSSALHRVKAAQRPSGVDSGGAKFTPRRHQAETPGHGAAETRRRCRFKAAPSPSGVDPTSVKSTQRRHQAAAPSQGAAETRRRRRVPVVLPRSIDTRRRRRLSRRVKALQRSGCGAESRRRRVPAVMIQAAPTAATPGGGAE